jgi:hypothetical protein
MIVVDELGRKWKEAIVTYFKVLFRHFSGEGEGNHENPHSR